MLFWCPVLSSIWYQLQTNCIPFVKLLAHYLLGSWINCMHLLYMWSKQINPWTKGLLVQSSLRFHYHISNNLFRSYPAAFFFWSWSVEMLTLPEHLLLLLVFHFYSDFHLMWCTNGHLFIAIDKKGKQIKTLHFYIFCWYWLEYTNEAFHRVYTHNDNRFSWRNKKELVPPRGMTLGQRYHTLTGLDVGKCHTKFQLSSPEGIKVISCKRTRT